MTHANEERDGNLKSEHLGPVVCASVDHFESRLLGQTVDSFGKSLSDKHKGGCIFVDHGTGSLHVEHQLGFSAIETIRAKQSYENKIFEHGVVVQSYLTDSGAFKVNAFVQHIRDHAQQIKYCGTMHSIRTELQKYRYGQSPIWLVLCYFIHRRTGRMASIAACGQWLLRMRFMFTITHQMRRIAVLPICSLVVPFRGID